MNYINNLKSNVKKTDLDIESAKEYIESYGFELDFDYERISSAFEHFEKTKNLDWLLSHLQYLQNCGGYALEIPTCIFAGDDYTFEEKVQSILRLYPFTRLLSDTKLKASEYLVMFRAGKSGHHFIKVTDSGEVIEKESAELPQKFDGWKKLSNSPQATFAVLKKQYRTMEMKNLPQCNSFMFLDQEAYMIEDSVLTRKRIAPKPITLTDKILAAYNSGSYSFEYNQKNFYLKDSEVEELIDLYDENDKLGSLYTDGETVELDLIDENKVYGFEPPIPVLDDEGRLNTLYIKNIEK